MSVSGILILLSGIFSSSCAHAQVPAGIEVSCPENALKQIARSEELQVIVKADQDDRKNLFQKPPEEILEVVRRDEARRKRVGEIFGEGCFKSSADFAAAALVYQHGIIPDHYFQTYVWSKRAVELGDPTQNRLMGLGIDRYLTKSGHKQLFGSQASKPTPDAKCWCLDPVEKTFPDTERKKVVGKTLSEAMDWIDEMNRGTNCEPKECAVARLPTPKGSVPGLW